MEMVEQVNECANTCVAFSTEWSIIKLIRINTSCVTHLLRIPVFILNAATAKAVAMQQQQKKFNSYYFHTQRIWLTTYSNRLNGKQFHSTTSTTLDNKN